MVFEREGSRLQRVAVTLFPFDEPAAAPWTQAASTVAAPAKTMIFFIVFGAGAEIRVRVQCWQRVLRCCA